MKTKLLTLSVSLFLAIASTAQTTIWSEDFSSYPNGTNNLNQTNNKWYSTAQDADDGGINNDATNYWGVYNGEFKVNDIEGTLACTTGGNNDNFWYSEEINVAAFPNFTISMKGRAEGTMECGGGCNAADLLEGSYQLDGGAWVNFFAMCGATDGTVSAGCIQVGNAQKLRIRIQAGTQSNGESYYFDDIKVLASPQITGEASINIGGTGNYSIAATGGIWSSSNPSIASVDNTGTVSAHANGSCSIIYLMPSGCSISKSINIITPCIPPSISATTPASRCGGGQISLSATASSGSIYWYEDQTATQSIATGNTLSLNLSASKTYYVEASNGTCASARTAVNADILTQPSITSTTDASRQSSGILQLEATASSGSINWYNSASASSVLATGTSFTTPTLSSSTTYYAEAVDGSCISTRQAVQANIVNILADAGSLTPNVCACKNTSKQINLNATSPSLGTGQWSIIAKPQNATQTVFANAAYAQTTVTFDAYGNYSFRWTVSAGGYTATDDVSVEIQADTIAPNFSTQLPDQKASYAPGCLSLVPDLREMVRNICSDNCTPQAQLQISQFPVAGSSISSDTELMIRVSDLCGNISTAYVTVKARKAITASLSANTEIIPPIGADVELEVKLDNTEAEEQYSYQWSPALSSSNTYTGFLSEAQQFQVSVSTADGFCTTQSNTVEIKIQEVILQTLLIPNSASSNNRQFGGVDLNNIDLQEYFPQGYKIAIYNRYGQLVANLENEAWDGNINGKSADAGVYYYNLLYTDARGQQKTFRKASLEVIKK